MATAAKTISSCYSPTIASNEMDIINYYNEPSNLVRLISIHNCRDMNEHTDKHRKKKYC